MGPDNIDAKSAAVMLRAIARPPCRRGPQREAARRIRIQSIVDAARVRADLQTTRNICQRHGCPLEFILKDISTVRYEPQRLWQWGRLAMEVARG